MADMAGMVLHHYSFLISLTGIVSGFVFCLGLSTAGKG